LKIVIRNIVGKIKSFKIFQLFIFLFIPPFKTYKT